MAINPYLYEKLVATRHAEIRHAMRQSSKPARSKQSAAFVAHVADKLGTMLIELGSRLQLRRASI
jgi:hypothetical protein